MELEQLGAALAADLQDAWNEDLDSSEYGTSTHLRLTRYYIRRAPGLATFTGYRLALTRAPMVPRAKGHGALDKPTWVQVPARNRPNLDGVVWPA